MNTFFSITKPLNQYPNIKAQTSQEIEPLEINENSTFVFDDMLISKQESNIDCFLQEDGTTTLIYTTNLIVNFLAQKRLLVNFLR